MDASSKFQESLPVSSDALLGNLDAWGITYELHRHVPLHTVSDSKLVQHEFLTTEAGGGHIKNLYLRDKKKRNYLVVVEQDREVDLKALPDLIGSGRLSFGSPDRLMDHLGVRPGAVTPFSMITGITTGVELFVDASLRDCKRVYAHPLVNDRTISMTPESLVSYFDKLGCAFQWITLP